VIEVADRVTELTTVVPLSNDADTGVPPVLRVDGVKPAPAMVVPIAIGVPATTCGAPSVMLGEAKIVKFMVALLPDPSVTTIGTVPAVADEEITIP